METRLHLLKPFAPKPGRGPVYHQLAGFIEALIRVGLYPPGTRLPAEREAAGALGVSRTTVAAAYARLCELGLAAARPGSGTFVAPRDALARGGAAAASPPDLPAPWAEPPPVTLGNLLDIACDGSVISFAAGTPAPDSMPDGFADLVARVVSGWLSNGRLVAHTPPEGMEDLRAAVAGWIGGSQAAAEEILITSGSQQALDLVARLFVRPGDAVLVERPTYVGAVQLFKAVGAHVVEAHLGSQGGGRLVARLRELSPRLIYVVPSFRNPTGQLMGAREREEVLELARALKVPVVEDEAYRELWFDEPPPAPLWSLVGPGHEPPVIAVGTVSKVLSPALRLGWVRANPELVAHLARIKQVSDLHTSTLSQAVVLECLQSGLLAGHVEKLRVLYRARRDAAAAALADCLPQARFELPKGGFYLWCALDGVDTISLLAAALRHGTAFVPGPSFYAAGDGREWLRLSYASPPYAAIREGIRRLAAAVAEQRPVPGLESQAALALFPTARLR